MSRFMFYPRLVYRIYSALRVLKADMNPVNISLGQKPHSRLGGHMHPLDTTDFVLIGIALAAFGAHFIYSRYKKVREEDERRRLEREQPEQPQVWSGTK